MGTWRRGYTDVREIVRGYWLLLERGGSQGRFTTSAPAGAGRSRIAVKEDPARRRPSDVPHLLGDVSKAREALGWKPEIPFEQTLLDTLEYWRRRIKAAVP